MGRIQFAHTYNSIISLENLLLAWKEFSLGKQKKKDVQIFQLRLLRNISDLQEDLQNKRYRHGGYEAFEIRDPKPRDIHKANVRDRLLHQAVHRMLYPFFDKVFVADSYSCQIGKGTHKAFKRFTAFALIVSKNYTCTAWVLKCDVRKFFANIDHQILFSTLAFYISDVDILRLLNDIVKSFSNGRIGVGLPLGNLTSHLLVNIYMNEFDQFVKHRLKTKYYIRYADDFVILSKSKAELENTLPLIREFLWERLKLSLHPDKVFIKTFTSGVDFLGWIHFPKHRLLRAVTKRRVFKVVANGARIATLQSYKAHISHGDAYLLEAVIEEGIRERCEEL